MLKVLMYSMSLFFLMIKIRSYSRTAPNLVASVSVLNCFLSCHVLFSKSNTKHVSWPSNMAYSFHDRARMFAIGCGIGVERRVQVFSTGLKTCVQFNRF